MKPYSLPTRYMKKPTRDELIAEAAQLRMIVDKLEKDDEKFRESLSVALGAGTRKKSTYGEEEQVIYSWFAIFCEIGKLLERKQQTDLQQNVQSQQEQLEILQRDVQRLTDPKTPFCNDGIRSSNLC